MAILTNLTNKKRLYIGVGAVISLTTIILPLSLVLTNSKPVFVDLHLLEEPHDHFKIEQIHNGVRIKIDDSVSHKYFIKNVFVPSGVLSDKKVALQGDGSAIVNVINKDGRIVAYIYDIAEDAHIGEFDVYVQDDRFWILSAMGLVSPLVKEPIQLGKKVDRVDFHINKGLVVPSNFSLVHAADGVYFIIDRTSKLSLIGNVKVKGDIVPFVNGIRMRTVHLSNRYILSVIDLYDGYYKISYSQEIEPEIFPFAVTRALALNPTSSVMSIEEFFRGYVRYVFPVAAKPEPYYGVFNFDFAKKGTYPNVAILTLDDYIYIYPESPIESIGNVSVAGTPVAALDVASYPRTLLLKKVSGKWFIMVADSYPEFNMVSRGFTLIAETKVMDDFARSFNIIADVAIEGYGNPIVPLTNGIKRAVFVRGEYISPPSHLSVLYASRLFDMKSEHMKLIDQVDVDLGADTLPEEIMVFPGNVMVLSCMNPGENSYSIIGRVQWGNFVVEANKLSILRSVVVMRFPVGHAFFVLDFDVNLRASMSPIYQVPSFPKWLVDLPFIDVIYLNQQLYSAMANIKGVFDYLSDMRFDGSDEAHAAAKMISAQVSEVPREKANLKKKKTGAQKPYRRIAPAAPSAPAAPAAPASAPVAKAENNKVVAPQTVVRTEAAVPIRYITIDIKGLALDKSLQVKTIGSLMYLRASPSKDVKYIIEKITYGPDNVAFLNAARADIVLECMYVNDEFFVRIYKEAVPQNTKIEHISALKFLNFKPKWYKVAQ